MFGFVTFKVITLDYLITMANLLLPMTEIMDMDAQLRTEVDGGTTTVPLLISTDSLQHL